MHDQNLPAQTLALRRPRTGLAILWSSLAAFLLGALLVGWLAWDGRLEGLLRQVSAERSAPVLPTPRRDAVPAAGTPATSLDATGAMETRLALLEERLSRVDTEVDAAYGNAARAEALLVAAAARRMIDKGAPLGYVEDQLKLRFADAQPNAVRTIIDTAKSPLTLDELSGQLDTLAPSLARVPSDEGAWTRIRREVSNLLVIRRESTPSPEPSGRIGRAKLLLAEGKIDAAVAEVERLPGAGSATDWIARARRYEAAQRALDLIETTAMLEPRQLHDAAGNRVTQPSPLADPTAEASGRPATP